jgi:nitroimidazol reductase NimA-like FMN-containing flavoprotein (pyridoxamine 5'-phosphate oxidase superfamily)
MVRTLSDMQSRSLLQSSSIGRLGCVFKGEPYVVPINYVFEEDCVFSHSLPGQKIDALRINPRSCLQVDVTRGPLRWSSVIAYGKFQEITDAKQRHQVISRILRRHPMLTPVESTIATDGAPADVIVFQIRIDKITGMSEGEVSDYELLECLGTRTDEF